MMIFSGLRMAGPNWASASATVAFFGAAWTTLRSPSRFLPAITSSVFAGTTVFNCCPARATSRMRSPSFTPRPLRRLHSVRPRGDPPPCALGVGACA